MQDQLWVPDEETESLGTCWGLDPGTVVLALGIHNGFEYKSMSRSLPKHPDPLRRLAAALPVAQVFLEQAKFAYGQPSLVVIEQPAGQGHNIHPATWFATGMTAMAVVNVVDCPVQMLTPPVWKSEGMGQGQGHANKGQVQTWVRARGWKGTGEHEADASVIARCAYKRLAKHLAGAVS